MQTKNNHKKSHTNTNIRFSRQQTLLKQSDEIWINLLQRNRDFEHSTCPIDCLFYDGNGCSMFAYTTHSGTITIILQICGNLNFTKESTRWTTIHDNAFSSHKKKQYSTHSKAKRKKPLFKHCSTLKQNFVCIDFLSTFKSINPISLDNPYLRPVSNTVLSWYYQQKNVNKRSSFLNGDYTDVWVEKIL